MPQPGSHNRVSSTVKLHATLLGAMLILLINTIPYLALLNLFFFAGSYISGFIALRRTILRYQVPLTTGQAFLLGSTAGLMGAYASELTSVLLVTLFHYQPGSESINLLFETLVSMARERPELQGTVNELRVIREQATSSTTISFTDIFSSITVAAIFYMPACGIGGATAVWILKRQAAWSRRH